MWNLLLLTAGKRSKVADYYKKQERLLEGFTEMENMAENGYMPGNLTEVGCVQLDDFEWQLVEQNGRIISEFGCITNIKWLLFVFMFCFSMPHF